MNGQKPGDLLFWISLKENKSDLAQSISDVGGGLDAPFHVSMIADNASEVIHSITDGVRVEPIRDVIGRYLLEHQKLKLVFATLVGVTDREKLRAVKFATSKIGRQYNDTFEESRADSDEAYYCCQLIRKAYGSGSDAQVKFPLRQLNFRDSKNEILQFWVDYFKQRNLSVPESSIGSHPADLYRSDIIKILSSVEIGNEHLAKT